MRVLILTPTALPAVTGNAVTAERWRQGLARRGHEVEVRSTAGLSRAGVAAELRRVAPHVVHAHHAYRAGSLVPATGGGPPLVVSLAGTDLYEDLRRRGRAEAVREVLARARAVVCQGEETALELLARVPEARGRVARVPKAFAWLGDEPFDARGAAGCGPCGVLFFLPAGVRPVKGNRECLESLEEVWGLRPQVRALFAGPALDPAYAARFGLEVARRKAFATWVPGLPPAAMRAAYAGADVVLNASRAEGLSNALIEAAAAGRPVLASDVPGNRGPLLGGGLAPAGLLYDPADRADFVARAVRLVDDEGLRADLAAGGRARAAARPSPEEEAEALEEVYARALEGRPGSR